MGIIYFQIYYKMSTEKKLKKIKQTKTKNQCKAKSNNRQYMKV
jgi:hypothetical protein